MTELSRLIWITDQLRAHCPWTGQLTHEELTSYLIEEAYEAVEAIETGSELPDELGDVLFQVVLHSAVAKDAGSFDIEDVAAAINAKMIRRNPHVFTPDGKLLPADQLDRADIDQVEKQWEAIKRSEKTDASPTPHTPAGLPALAAATKVIDRLQRREPTTNPAVIPPEVAADETALGRYLYELVAQCRAAGTDPERALRQHLNSLN